MINILRKDLYFFRLVFILFLVLLFLSPAFGAEKKGQASLPKDQIEKLRDIAVIIAGEISRRNITTVTLNDFTDISGKPSVRGKAISAEFKKQMEAAGKGYFKVMNTGGSAVVKGIFLPFAGNDKWKLDIKVLSPDNRLITSYTAFYRNTKGGGK